MLLPRLLLLLLLLLPLVLLLLLLTKTVCYSVLGGGDASSQASEISELREEKRAAGQRLQEMKQSGRLDVTASLGWQVKTSEFDAAV